MQQSFLQMASVAGARTWSEKEALNSAEICEGIWRFEIECVLRVR